MGWRDQEVNQQGQNRSITNGVIGRQKPPGSCEYEPSRNQEWDGGKVNHYSLRQWMSLLRVRVKLSEDNSCLTPGMPDKKEHADRKEWWGRVAEPADERKGSEVFE